MPLRLRGVMGRGQKRETEDVLKRSAVAKLSTGGLRLDHEGVSIKVVRHDWGCQKGDLKEGMVGGGRWNVEKVGCVVESSGMMLGYPVRMLTKQFAKSRAVMNNRPRT